MHVLSVFVPEFDILATVYVYIYEGHTESHDQLFFASELGTANEGEYGGRWNELLCYP